MQTSEIDEDQLAIGHALERVFAWLRENRETAGLSASTISALSRLDGSGSLRITELSALEGLTQPGMTTLINRLEDAGLAIRESDPLDGRAVRVSITALGVERIRDHRETRATRIATRLSELPESDQRALIAARTALEAFASTTPREIAQS